MYLKNQSVYHELICGQVKHIIIYLHNTYNYINIINNDNSNNNDNNRLQICFYFKKTDFNVGTLLQKVSVAKIHRKRKEMPQNAVIMLKTKLGLMDNQRRPA